MQNDVAFSEHIFSDILNFNLTLKWERWWYFCVTEFSDWCIKWKDVKFDKPIILPRPAGGKKSLFIICTI